MGTSIKEETIQLSTLSQDLLDDLVVALSPYQVGLLGVTRANTGDSINYCGSGTFISRQGQRYILTAGHVWQCLSAFEEIGLCIRTSIHDITVLRKELVPHVVHNPTDLEWGPDIALVELSERAADLVTADRQFLDLGSSMPSLDLSSGLVAVVGAPSESSSIGTQTAALHAGPWIGGVAQYKEVDGFDYFDIGVDVGSPSLPEFFGGISGGPAWQTFLVRTGGTAPIAWKKPLELVGVAIRQVDLDGRERFVRCHGPKSIYEAAFQAAGVAQ